jgi:uncharacterized membrane protein SirB2
MIMKMLLLIHVLTVIISICGFILRGLLKFNNPDRSLPRWLKIFPHVNDTILLVSALFLVNLLGLELLHTPWLQAKIIALFVYIVLGFIAFRFGRSRKTRMAAWLFAIAVYAYIVAVAVTRNPLLSF